MDNRDTFLPRQDARNANTPVIPLPPIVAPDAQIPAYPGEEPSEPSLPIAPDDVPPAYPGNTFPGYSRIRFLFAAVNYDPVNISIGLRRLVTGLSYGNISGYSTVRDGFRTITVTLSRGSGRVILRKTLPLRAGETLTIALINTMDGVDLLPIPDQVCNNRPRGRGCFRVVNLSPNSGPLDVMLADGRMIYSDLYYKEVSAFKRVRPGRYSFVIAETPQNMPMPINEDIEVLSSPEESAYYVDQTQITPLLTFSAALQAGILYTVYIIGRVAGTPALATLLVENR